MAKILPIVLNICLLSLAVLAQSDDGDLEKNSIHLSSNSDDGNMVQRIPVGTKGGQDDSNKNYTVANKVDFSEAVRALSGNINNMAPYVISRGHKRIRMKKISTTPIETEAVADVVADTDNVTAQSDDQDLDKSIIHMSSNSDGGNMVQRVTVGIKGGQDDTNEKYSIGKRVDFSEAVGAQSGNMNDMAPYVISRGQKRIRMKKVFSPIETGAVADMVANTDEVKAQSDDEDLDKSIIYMSSNSDGGNMVQRVTVGIKGAQDDTSEKYSIGKRVDFSEAVETQSGNMNDMAPYVIPRGKKRIRMKKVFSPIETDAVADDVTTEMTAERIRTHSSENTAESANAMQINMLSKPGSSSPINEKVFVKNNMDFAEAVKAQTNIMNNLTPYTFPRGYKRLPAHKQVKKPMAPMWRPVETVTDFSAEIPMMVESYADGVPRGVKKVRPQYEESNVVYFVGADDEGMTTNKHKYVMKKCDTTNENKPNAWRQIYNLLKLDQTERKSNAATLKKFMSVLKKVMNSNKYPELDKWSMEEVVQSIMSELIRKQSKISRHPDHKRPSIEVKADVPKSLMFLSRESDEKSSEDSSEDSSEELKIEVQPKDTVPAESEANVTYEGLVSHESDEDAKEPLKGTEEENNFSLILEVVSKHLKNRDHIMTANEINELLYKIMDKVVQEPVSKCREDVNTKLIETLQAVFEEYLEAGKKCPRGKRFHLTNKHVEQMLAMPEMKAVMNEMAKYRHM